MFNTIGKILVLINLGFALLAMAFAAGIFLQQVDFGWKEPRKNLEQRVPSEIDKRSAAVTEAYRALETVQPDLKPAQTQLRQAEDRFGPNHLFYVAQLKRIHSDRKPLTAPEIVLQGGKPQLDKEVIGKPVFGKPAPLIAKSYAAYEEDLKRLVGEVDLKTKKKIRFGEIDKIEAEIQALIAQEKEQTLKLLGLKDDAGKVLKPGLYGLREVERKRFDQVKFEIEYLRPKVQETRLEANGYLERRTDLEATLEAFKKK
jgi:Skp family chaperone for outer membrane proteins